MVRLIVYVMISKRRLLSLTLFLFNYKIFFSNVIHSFLIGQIVLCMKFLFSLHPVAIVKEIPVEL